MRHAIMRTAVVLMAVMAPTPAGASTTHQNVAIYDATCDVYGQIEVRPASVERPAKLQFLALQLSCGTDSATMSGTLRATAAGCEHVEASGALTITWSDTTTSTVHFGLTYTLFDVDDATATMQGQVRTGRYAGDHVKGIGGVDSDTSHPCGSKTTWYFFSHRSATLQPFSFRHPV